MHNSLFVELYKPRGTDSLTSHTQNGGDCVFNAIGEFVNGNDCVNVSAEEYHLAAVDKVCGCENSIDDIFL